MKLEGPARPLAADPGGEGERKEPQIPTSNKRMEHGHERSFPCRRDDSDDKGGLLFHFLALTPRQSRAEAAANETLQREGGNTNTSQPSQPERPSETLPVPWRTPKHCQEHQHTEEDGRETGGSGNVSTGDRSSASEQLLLPLLQI